MDQDLSARLDQIDRGQKNLAAATALILRHLTVQGERLDAIEGLLTPEPKDPDQPTLQELLQQWMEAQQAAAEAIAQRLVTMHKILLEMPLSTTEAIHDNLGPLAKAAP